MGSQSIHLTFVDEGGQLAHHVFQHCLLADHPSRLLHVVVLADFVLPRGYVAAFLIQEQFRYLVGEKGVA